MEVVKKIIKKNGKPIKYFILKVLKDIKQLDLNQTNISKKKYKNFANNEEIIPRAIRQRSVEYLEEMLNLG
jgi:hypothetical protein